MSNIPISATIHRQQESLSLTPTRAAGVSQLLMQLVPPTIANQKFVKADGKFLFLFHIQRNKPVNPIQVPSSAHAYNCSSPIRGKQDSG